MLQPISDIDYTQPFGQRAPEEFPLKFHHFLVVLNGIVTALLFLPLLLSLSMLSSFHPMMILPQLGGSAVFFCLQAFIFFSLLFKRRWIITIYQICFWLQVGFGVLGLVILCFVGSVFGTLLAAGSGAFMGLLAMLLVGGLSIGLILFITHCILKYYRRREHLLK